MREQATIAAKIARLHAAGVPAHEVSPSDLYRLEPWLAPDLAGGLLVPQDAVVYPPNVARALVARACRANTTLQLGRRVQALQPGGVLLDDGSRLYGPSLIATGCALPDLLPSLPLRRRKGHLVVTAPHPGAVSHQILELGYADSAHGTADSSVACNVQPRPGGQLLIGSSREYGSESAEVSMSMAGCSRARSSSCRHCGNCKPCASGPDFGPAASMVGPISARCQADAISGLRRAMKDLASPRHWRARSS
jgi:glycine/D-amino acid oxidase-like deaminating enzyme